MRYDSHFIMTMACVQPLIRLRSKSLFSFQGYNGGNTNEKGESSVLTRPLSATVIATARTMWNVLHEQTLKR